MNLQEVHTMYHPDSCGNSVDTYYRDEFCLTIHEQKYQACKEGGRIQINLAPLVELTRPYMDDLDNARTKHGKVVAHKMEKKYKDGPYPPHTMKQWYLEYTDDTYTIDVEGILYTVLIRHSSDPTKAPLVAFLE